VELLLVHSFVNLGYRFFSSPDVPNPITGQQNKVDLTSCNLDKFWLRADQLLTRVKFFPSLELKVRFVVD